MMLIADAGSTKTDWAMADDGTVSEFISIPGINPTHMPPGEMVELLRTALPAHWITNVFVEKIVFYGAGCGNSKGIQRMDDALRAVFPYAELEIYTDILGAARALWGKQPGIACILGTGANAGYYDGEQVFTRPSLGYLLGDEASGASLGKAFLKMYLRNQLPLAVSESFEQETRLTYSLIMENLYMKPFPAQFLASLALFVLQHRSQPDLQALIDNELNGFLEHMVMPLSRDFNCNRLSFMGSVAYALEKEIRQKVFAADLHVEQFIQSPIRSLVEFHLIHK
ncbi:MAG: hypothetical protein PWR20_2498 [Bacteroidales bacterium]|nr:hypothetical protein [Bacteroidales bacterium]MDN5330431.1 hypothetical protein [Bacteroidales bacterium]